jgi:hypothetical protein
MNVATIYYEKYKLTYLIYYYVERLQLRALEIKTTRKQIPSMISQPRI